MEQIQNLKKFEGEGSRYSVQRRILEKKEVAILFSAGFWNKLCWLDPT